MRDGMSILVQQREKRPRIKVECWFVKQLGQTIFRNVDYGLCKDFIKNNALKGCTITSKK